MRESSVTASWLSLIIPMLDDLSLLLLILLYKLSTIANNSHLANNVSGSNKVSVQYLYALLCLMMIIPY